MNSKEVEQRRLIISRWKDNPKMESKYFCHHGVRHSGTHTCDGCCIKVNKK